MQIYASDFKSKKCTFVNFLVRALTATIISGNTALAAPAITSVSSTGDSKLQNGTSLIIQGTGLTNKSQDTTVFYDHTDIAWEDGIKNDRQSSFEEMELIKRPNQDSETIWGKPSLPPSDDEFNTGMRITKKRPGRTSLSEAHYYAKGNNNFLGWPTVIGGTDVKRKSRRTYISFWFKMPFDLANYYSISGDSDSEQFKTGGEEEYGESIKIEGIEGKGKIIAYEKELGDVKSGWLFFLPPKSANSNKMKGKTITGLESGTQIVFPESYSTGKFDQEGYLRARGKYARLWTDNDGYQYALGNIGISGTGKSIWLNDFDSSLPKSGEWNKFEVEIAKPDYQNKEDPSLKVYLNDELYMRGDQEWQESVIAEKVNDEKAISLALLGINDFMPVPFTTELDDIYMDLDFNRVMLCSESDIEKVRDGKGICEIQLIKSWTQSQVKIRTYLGNLPSEAGTVYAYVFDSRGTPNSEGFPIDITSLPKAPTRFKVK